MFVCPFGREWPCGGCYAGGCGALPALSEGWAMCTTPVRFGLRLRHSPHRLLLSHCRFQALDLISIVRLDSLSERLRSERAVDERQPMSAPGPSSLPRIRRSRQPTGSPTPPPLRQRCARRTPSGCAALDGSLPDLELRRPRQVRRKWWIRRARPRYSRGSSLEFGSGGAGSGSGWPGGNSPNRAGLPASLGSADSKPSSAW